MIGYCPICGKEIFGFRSDMHKNEGYGNCPEHGFIRVECNQLNTKILVQGGKMKMEKVVDFKGVKMLSTESFMTPEKHCGKPEVTIRFVTEHIDWDEKFSGLKYDEKYDIIIFRREK